MAPGRGSSSDAVNFKQLTGLLVSSATTTRKDAVESELSSTTLLLEYSEIQRSLTS